MQKLHYLYWDRGSHPSDALHAFPPDLGQGVNVAFCEEAAAIHTENKESVMTRALRHYEEKNIPEVRALIALSRVGAPFQYGKNSMKFRKFLWIANLTLRMLLNKLTLGVSPKPAIIMMTGVRNLLLQRISVCRIPL